MSQEITTILSGFRRPHTLKEQFEAVCNQTIKPTNVFYWQNFHPDGVNADPEIINKCLSVVSNINWGVWARFAFALNAKTKYVCILDDDTIPGNRWFENCLNTMTTHRGLLGTRGVIFRPDGNYHDNQGVGWETANEEVTQVDIIGHSWFFEREWLAAYWRELPDPRFFVAGEDIHFSYTIQKYLGLNSYVPLHPKNDKSLWGSLKACELGIGPQATSNIAMPQMQDYLQTAIKGGFKLLRQPK